MIRFLANCPVATDGIGYRVKDYQAGDVAELNDAALEASLVTGGIAEVAEPQKTIGPSERATVAPSEPAGRPKGRPKKKNASTGDAPQA